MKKNSVFDRLFCVFKPKKTPCDILSEAEKIIEQYISDDNDFDYITENGTARIGAALNIALIVSALILAYLMFKVLR